MRVEFGSGKFCFPHSKRSQSSDYHVLHPIHRTARESPDYNLKEWTLCVPVPLTKEDLRWFDEWRSAQDRPIELMDGDDLTRHLAETCCASIRKQFCE